MAVTAMSHEPGAVDELILICTCSALDHAVRFTRWDDGLCAVDIVDRPELSLWGRLKLAWRILTRGRPCRYSGSEIILDSMHLSALGYWAARGLKAAAGHK